MRVNPGDKVKVYCNSTYNALNETVRYGEALGVNEAGKIILQEHPEFSKLTVGAFKHFRPEREVVFLDDAQQALRMVQLSIPFQLQPAA